MSRLAEDIYDRLFERMLKGEYPNRTHLAETDIAAEFQTSRSPVRRAFQLLALDGLVEISSNSRTYVSYPDANAIEEVFELRVTLESLALEKAVPRLDLEKLRLFAERLDKLWKDYLNGNLDRKMFMEADWEFHNFLVEASGMRRLRDILDSLMRMIHCFSRYGLSYPERLEQVFDEHRRLIKKLLLRDGGGAVSLLRLHLDGGRKAALNGLFRGDQTNHE